MREERLDTEVRFEKIKKIDRCGILAGLSGFIFVLLLSSWTSPMFPGAYGYDCAFFSMVGRAILEGKVMYRDYFDIKGPVFFFWEAFGQFLHRDRLGIFLLQVICSVTASYFVYKICCFYRLKVRNMIAVFVVYYLVYSVALWGGNTVEEFCLPLNLACIYFGLQFLYGTRKSIDIAYFYGLTFGICLLSKVTVCAPMGAIVLAVTIKLIVEKEWKNLFGCILYFLLGAATIVLPVCIYYMARGALYEMLLCSFRIAFARGTDFYVTIDWDWERPILICYFGLLLSVWGYILPAKNKREKTDGYVLCILSTVTILALHLGTPFDYYFINTLPVLVLVAIYVIRNVNMILGGSGNQTMDEPSDESVAASSRDENATLYMKRMIFGIVAIMIVLSTYWGRSWGKIKENFDLCVKEGEMWNYEACQDIFALVPENERDEVFGIESGMIVYEVNQRLPMNRYPVNMPYFCELYEPAENEILDDLEARSVKWVMTEDITELENDNIKIYVLQHYDRISEIGNNCLWRRKGM